ncbi:MAG: PGF-pre-PGF domain-containing protein, partial [Nanoarchaeota archaeon]
AKKNERKKGIFNWNSISIREIISMRDEDKDNAFRRVDFKSKSALRGVVVKMLPLSPKPDTLPPASKKVYQYLEITLENIGDNDIESALISFSVPEKWYKENGIGPESILLYRYSKNIWEKLKTKITGSEGSEVIYEAESSGFSSFAVGSEELDIPNTDNLTKLYLTELDTTPEQNVSSPQNKDNKDKDEKKEDEKPKEDSKESGNKEDKDKEDVIQKNETKDVEAKEEDEQDDLETLKLEDGNIEEQEIKGKIMETFFKEMRQDEKKSGKIGRKEDLETIKIRKPDFIISQQIKSGTLFSIINEISIKKFIDEKADFIASKIGIKNRQITEEQLNSEVEYLADVSMGEMPIIQDNVRDSIIKFRESRNNIELEKNVHYIDSQSNSNERLSVVKLKVKPRNTLRGFSIYEKIPKEVAKNIDEIIFYDNNYRNRNIYAHLRINIPIFY